MDKLKLAEFIEKHIGSCEKWERGDTEVTWKDRDCYDYHDILIEMAEDIINFLTK